MEDDKRYYMSEIENAAIAVASEVSAHRQEWSVDEYIGINIGLHKLLDCLYGETYRSPTVDAFMGLIGLNNKSGL